MANECVKDGSHNWRLSAHYYILLLSIKGLTVGEYNSFPEVLGHFEPAVRHIGSSRSPKDSLLESLVERSNYQPQINRLSSHTSAPHPYILYELIPEYSEKHRIDIETREGSLNHIHDNHDT